MFALFDKMISSEYLFKSWDLFRRGKRHKLEVQIFERHREDNIFALQEELRALSYVHGPYTQFDVFDPKRRHISAACVKDRLVHQLVYGLLYELFDKKFIFHSFASRLGKGTHAGSLCLSNMIRKVGRNDSRHCFSLKMDISRFFDNIDLPILKHLIRQVISDEKLLVIIDIIIDSFQTSATKKIGVPLGNLTSQLFSNIYLHELDMFVKHHLKQKFYLRYCDDFIFLSHNASELKALLPVIESFLRDSLKLELHPKKIISRSARHGIDFLGYLHFPHHRLMRPVTKRRMIRKLNTSLRLFHLDRLSLSSLNQSLQSYLGILLHANQHHLSQHLKNTY
jgi:retron-type reverse transcriptase